MNTGVLKCLLNVAEFVLVFIHPFFSPLKMSCYERLVHFKCLQYGI